jgi:hypothetical protein
MSPEPPEVLRGKGNLGRATVARKGTTGSSAKTLERSPSLREGHRPQHGSVPGDRKHREAWKKRVAGAPKPYEGARSSGENSGRQANRRRGGGSAAMREPHHG